MKDNFSEKDKKDFCFSFGVPSFRFFLKDMSNFFSILNQKEPCCRYFENDFHSNHLIPFMGIKKDHEKYEILFELPGVSKDDINLEITSEELWLEAISEEVKKKFKKHMIFKNRININETKSILKNGILKIIAPFEEKINKTKLRID